MTQLNACFDKSFPLSSSCIHSCCHTDKLGSTFEDTERGLSTFDILYITDCGHQMALSPHVTYHGGVFPHDPSSLTYPYMVPFYSPPNIAPETTPLFAS